MLRALRATAKVQAANSLAHVRTQRAGLIRTSFVYGGRQPQPARLFASSRRHAQHGDLQPESSPPPQETPLAESAAASAGAQQGTADMRPPTPLSLTAGTLQLLRSHVLSVVLVFALGDVVLFLLQRVGHRLINELAVRLLPSGLTPASIGDMWWISRDPSVANFQNGYLAFVVAFACANFPLTVLVKSLATTVAYRLIGKPAGEHSAGPESSSGGVVGRVKKAWRDVRGELPASVAAQGQMGRVSLLVAVKMLFWQGLSLLVVPLYWAVPRVLDLQLAVPAAMAEGLREGPAVRRSKELAGPIRKALFWPYVGLFAAVRAMEPLRALLLGNIPGRWYRELPEFPIALAAGLLLLSVVLSRMQDLLPLVAYRNVVASQNAPPVAATEMPGENQP